MIDEKKRAENRIRFLQMRIELLHKWYPIDEVIDRDTRREMNMLHDEIDKLKACPNWCKISGS